MSVETIVSQISYPVIVTVSQVGIQGPSGLSGNGISGSYYLASNPSGYITGFNSGIYYLNSNPSGYITGINTGYFLNISQTGQFYQSNNPSGYLNNLSGLSTGYVTGVSGYLQFQINTINLNPNNYANSGNLNNYYLLSNPSNYSTSGNLYSTGNILYYYITGASGNLTNVDNSTISNLQSTGSYLYNNLTGFSGIFNNSGAQYQSQINIISGNLSNYYLNSNPNHYTTSGDVSNTNTILLGYINNSYSFIVNLSGLSNTISGNLQTTGSNLYNQINNQINSLSGFVTGGYNFNYAQPLVKISNAYNVNSGDSIILVDATSSTIKVTMPNSSGLAGVTYNIKDWKGKSATNNITITGYYPQTIDGAVTKVISTNYLNTRIMSDGSNWSIM